MKKETYDNIYSLVEDTFDKKIAKEINDSLKAKELSRELFCAREMRNLSQEEVAKRLNKSIDYVDNLENEIINNISVKELIDFAKACNVDVGIFFRYTDNQISDKIKYHSRELLNLFETLGKMCKNDSIMLEGAFKIKMEALYNPIMCTLTTALELIESSSKISEKRLEQKIHLKTEIGEKDKVIIKK
jgi:transcriptional regulator with XRE-family HTH domain